MIKLILSTIIFFTTNTFAQTISDRQAKQEKQTGINNAIDTTLRVLYVHETSNHELPVAYYLNGRLVNQAFFSYLDPNQIESINVSKDSLQIEKMKYYGQIHVTTKRSYNPKIISLNELKIKYTNLKSEPTIFIIDGEVVSNDYDRYVFDENLLWRIIIDKIENEKENIHVKVIKLLTKKPENQKAKEIRIRGAEEALTK